MIARNYDEFYFRGARKLVTQYVQMARRGNKIRASWIERCVEGLDILPREEGMQIFALLRRTLGVTKIVTSKKLGRKAAEELAAEAEELAAERDEILAMKARVEAIMKSLNERDGIA